MYRCEKRQIKVCSKGGDIYVRIANTQEKIQIQGVLKRRGDMCGSRASQRAGMQSLVAHTSLLTLVNSLLNLASPDINPIVYSPHTNLAGMPKRL